MPCDQVVAGLNPAMSWAFFQLLYFFCPMCDPIQGKKCIKGKQLWHNGRLYAL